MAASSMAIPSIRSKRPTIGPLPATLDRPIPTGSSPRPAALDPPTGAPRTGALAIAGLALSVLLLVGLAEDAGPPRLSLTPAGFAALAGWAEDRVTAAVPALLRSCARFLARPDAASLDA